MTLKNPPQICTETLIFPHKFSYKLPDLIPAWGVSSKSTEEQFSSRREKTRGHQEDRKRNSRSNQETGCGWMKPRKLLRRNGTEEAEGKRGLARRSRPNLKGQTVVTREPNQVFENRKEGGEISKERSPLLLCPPFTPIFPQALTLTSAHPKSPASQPSPPEPATMSSHQVRT
jgi:hypothetical protein